MDTAPTPLTLADIHGHCTELGQQLCEAHLKIEDQALTIETLNRLFSCGDASALEDLRRSLRARVGDDMPACPSDAEVVELAKELMKTRGECVALRESNLRLQQSCAVFADAREMAVQMVEAADQGEIGDLRREVNRLQEGVKCMKAEYEWEYRRREEYAKELVRMRDLALAQDLELSVLRTLIGGGVDVGGSDVRVLKARIVALEGTIDTLYKDKYIDDRNKRMGVALDNVRDAAVALEEKDATIRSMARLIRRFERLTETSSAELESVRATDVQRRTEELYVKRVMVENELAALVAKKKHQDAKFIEISNDLNDMREEMMRARRELDERGSKAMMLQAECDRLEKELKTRAESVRDIDEKLAHMRSGKAFKEFEEMKRRMAADAETSAKARELTSRMVYNFEEQERMKAELERDIARLESRKETMESEIEGMQKRLRDA
jgi:hypothetical protein